MGLAKKTVWKKYRLKVGQHEDNDRSGKPRFYKAGDIFESKSDLETLNGRGMNPKFERIDDDAVLTNAPGIDPVAVAGEVREAATEKQNEMYESMTLNELKKFAEEEEIDLKGATKKDAIIAAIKEHPLSAAV